MTVISLTIPDELESALQEVPGSIEAFILETVRRELQPLQWASDKELEAAAVSDIDPDFLSQHEVHQYMSLPDA